MAQGQHANAVGGMVSDRRAIVVDHAVEWIKGNPNLSLKQEEKMALPTQKGKGKAKVSGVLKDPNVGHFEKIVLPKKYKNCDSKIVEANQQLVDHYNKIRMCKIAFIEIAKNSAGAKKSEDLKSAVEKFKSLSLKTADKYNAVICLKGCPVPLPEHLNNLPSVTQCTKGRPNSKK